MRIRQRHRTDRTTASILGPRIQAALAQLLQAHDFAGDVGRSTWDFAVEIRLLQVAGLTATDLRWLVCKGYVEHAREVTLAGEDGRSFRPSGNLTFSNRSNFVLTESGEAVARKFPWASVDRPQSTPGGPHTGQYGQTGLLLPEWDPQQRTLHYDGNLIKVYQRPAPNQAAVLSAFEEEGWPPRIDDPLSPYPDCVPQRRLNDTIKSLNRDHLARILHFAGDGTGKAVRWKLIKRAHRTNSR